MHRHINTRRLEGQVESGSVGTTRKRLGWNLKEINNNEIQQGIPNNGNTF